MHFAKQSEILVSLRFWWIFPHKCDIVLVRETRLGCYQSSISALNCALVLLSWLLEFGLGRTLWGHCEELPLTAQVCLTDQLTAQLCCVQSLQGKSISVEAVRKLVEKNQKQSFPVGEQAGIRRSGVQFESRLLRRIQTIWENKTAIKHHGMFFHSAEQLSLNALSQHSCGSLWMWTVLSVCCIWATQVFMLPFHFHWMSGFVFLQSTTGQFKGIEVCWYQ